MSEVPSQQASPAKGKGRGRGRNLAKAHAARAAAVKRPANGRRGRQKQYGSAVAQAASERMKELKTAFGNVIPALAAALDDLAQRNIDDLKNDPRAHEKVPQHREIVSFLNSRRDDTVAQHNHRLQADIGDVSQTWQLNEDIAKQAFQSKYDEATEDFYAAQLRRLEILEHLHDNSLPLDIIDAGYQYVELSKEKADDLGQHVEFVDDVEVPCAKTVSGKEEATEEAAAPKTPSKRKAEDEPEGQPNPKRPASAVDETAGSFAPRHIGGLLSAIAPPEEDGAASPGGDSKMPSPSPAPEEGVQSPQGSLEGEEAGPKASPVDNERLPPVPTGASDPDAFGLRLVNKRKTANSDINNRIMAPLIFDFEPYEIGFRDSTNDKSRGATRAKRGKFLGTPFSNTMHFDRSLWHYDATENKEGDLDAELIKKHGLHPKYGLFLRTSVNEAEASKPRVDGDSPVVFYTRTGKTFGTSRSVRMTKLDEDVKKLPQKWGLQAALEQFGEKEGIDQDAIQPSDKDIEEHRQLVLKDHVFNDEPSVAEDNEPEFDEEAQQASYNAVANLLRAATNVDAEEAAKAAAEATPRRSTVSRPFDPVRDVFLGAESPVHSPQAYPPVADTSKLSALVDMALSFPDHRPIAMGLADVPTYPRSQPFQHPGYQERQFLNPPAPAPPQGYAQLPGLDPPPPPPQAAYPENLDPRLFSGDHGPDHMNSAAPPPPPNAFLQTALNPPSQYSPIAPPIQYLGPPLAPVPPPHTMQPDMSPVRGPFNNSAQGTMPPGLPALRPSRSLLQLIDEAQPEPAYSPRQMAVPNNGGFYPPTAMGQPFHNTFFPGHDQSLGQPQPTTQAPMMTVQQYMPDPRAPGMHAQLQPPPPLPPVPIPTGPPGQHVLHFPMSPPFGGHAQLQPSPAIDPMLMQNSGETPPPRGHRASLSSGSAQAATQASAAAADSSKYRKLQPAPVPAHRLGWSSNSNELRTVQYDYREGIKDYTPVEPPPRTGPTTIRGWAYNNNVKKNRGGSKSEASPTEPQTPTQQLQPPQPDDNGNMTGEQQLPQLQGPPPPSSK